ncbi:MAG: PQQ-binding-like beta-propeller repeat protein [Elusimicrobia bacterium]|nr:PQQ-binding-like beta-propeller repeat protein [Elusimicrobiota bacterium]
MKTIALCLGLILAAAAARPAAAAAAAPALSTTTVQLVFPNPPDKARVKWVRSIKNMRDLKGRKESFFEKIFSFLAGGDVNQNFFVGAYGVYKQGSKLYVSDTGAQRLTVLDLDKAKIDFIGETGDDMLKSPVGVVADSDGTMFVTDTGDHSVKAYTAAGKLLWKTDALGTVGGKLNRPSGISPTPDGNLLVADNGNRRLVVLTKEGKFVKELCSHAKKDVFALANPNNVWVDKDGSFAVSDPLAGRIHVFTSTGGVIAGFGEPGDSPGYLARPRGVAMDSDGNIHVVDAVFSRVQIFNKQGQLLLWYATPGGGRGQLALPAGIFIDKDDMIYVADAKNQRIQVFQYIKYAEDKAVEAPAEKK